MNDHLSDSLLAAEAVREPATAAGCEEGVDGVDADELFRLNQQLSRTYFLRGAVYARKEEWTRAADDFTQVLQLEPGDVLALLRRAEAYSRTGDWMHAVADYDRLAVELTSFKRDFRKIAGEVAGQEKGTASEEFDRCKPHDASNPSQHRAWRHFKQGVVFQQRGDYDGAHEAYSAALAADPSCVEAYLERGLVSRLAGRFDEAIDDLTKVIELDEASAETYLRRAITYTEQRRFDLALADYAEAERLDPELAPVYVNRGLAHVTMGEFARAAEDADRALRIDPSLAGARFIRGTAYAKLGRFDEALADLDRALLLKPENPCAYNQRGLIYAAQGNYDDAVAEYTEALRLEPDCDPALFNRGTAYRLKGDCDQSVADFSLFIRRKPHNAQAYYHRGLAYQAKSAFDEAIADFNHARQLDPSLHRAYESCIEATRAKYEQKSATDNSYDLTLREDSSPATEEHPAAATQTEPPIRVPARDPIPSIVPEKPVPRPAPRSGVKLRLECPECGTAGLFDVRNLDRKFRCPGCSNWWRTDTAGVLVRADNTGSETAEASQSPTRVPATTPVPALPAAKAASKPVSLAELWGPPAGNLPAPAPAKPSKSAKKAKSAPALVRRGGRLDGTREWLGAVARTPLARLALLGTSLTLIVLLGGFVLSLFPSALRSRGQQAAQAWLARDVEQIQKFVEKSQVEQVPNWLKQNPPPELDGQPGPKVHVAVQNNDGKTAEILIQIKALKKDGTPAHFVFRQRWISREGNWYLKPAVSASRVSARQNQTS